MQKNIKATLIDPLHKVDHELYLELLEITVTEAAERMGFRFRGQPQYHEKADSI